MEIVLPVIVLPRRKGPVKRIGPVSPSIGGLSLRAHGHDRSWPTYLRWQDDYGQDDFRPGYINDDDFSTWPTLGQMR
jgi:hypothetical protein